MSKPWIVGTPAGVPPGSPVPTSGAIPARNAVIITAVNPPGPSITAQLGEKLPVTSSQGGWKLQPRPRRSGFTEYQGVDPYTLTLSILFEGYTTGQQVEDDVEVLRGIFRNRVGARNEPAVVRLTGPAVPLTWLDWVIQDIVSADELRDGTGRLVRAFREITFYQYLAPDVLSMGGSPAAAATQTAGALQIAAGSPATPGGRTYTVASGDTLSGIAVRLYGDINRWHDIADLNGIRDPTRISAGQILKVP